MASRDEKISKSTICYSFNTGELYHLNGRLVLVVM
jgi:hypothetical protein